ncbi:MAG: hypothetical protein KGL39_43790 [Patescibacteria group bacterium]|nr:hypothetical protein [Patescibacteria group bacterium]
MKNENRICPDCGRTKAFNAISMGKGCCPKWYAINDEAAKKDCKRVATTILTHVTAPTHFTKIEENAIRQCSIITMENEKLRDALLKEKKENDELKRLLAEKNETANIFMRQVKEAHEIIWDMCRNLDAADYARARKFVGMDTEESNASS